MDAHPEQSGHNTSNPMLAGSIALGSLLVGVFVPVFLIVGGGAIVWLVLSCVQIMRKNKALQAHLHKSLDTELRSTHNAHLLKSLIDAANIPVFGTDALGCIVHLNQRANRTLGISDAMIGRRFDEVLPQPALHDLESAARNGNPGHARLTLAIQGEMREFDVAADPISASNGAVLTFRDITELSRAMTLKADFVANASHELRTPIASIKGAAETLAGPAKDDERMSARLVEMIANNANRLELLATDLLDLSKLEAEDQHPTLETVSISTAFDKVLGELSAAAEHRGLSLVPAIEDGLDELLTDRSMLALMLRNLVGNAIKFAHQDTTVRIVAKRAPVALDRTAPIPDGLDRAQGVVIQVIDKGIGIPLAQQQRVFERFYQVDDARTGSGAGTGPKRGTGLGLAIVKHAAKRLGGSVQLESIHQEGTTITIQLPRCVD